MYFYSTLPFLTDRVSPLSPSSPCPFFSPALILNQSTFTTRNTSDNPRRFDTPDLSPQNGGLISVSTSLTIKTADFLIVFSSKKICPSPGSRRSVPTYSTGPLREKGLGLESQCRSAKVSDSLWFPPFSNPPPSAGVGSGGRGGHRAAGLPEGDPGPPHRLPQRDRGLS